MNKTRLASLAAACLALGIGAPALADLERGYAAWDRGDYNAAVREWRDLANGGNADAQFNMAQAYRLGRGVEQNAAQAEILMAKAAAQGHIQAIDTYGLLLFQNGRREEAMPYVMSSAGRGNPRAQYLLGIGHFNGDLVDKDWVRAYALMTLSNASGFEPAKAGIAQMDDFIPLEDRQKAQTLAIKLKQDADAQLKTQLASRDLGIGAAPPSAPPPPTRIASASQATSPTPAPTTRPLPSSITRIPQPIATTSVPPSVAAAKAAIAEATRVTGTESPAEAGADLAAAPSSATAPPATRPAQAARPAPVQAAASPAPAPSRAASATGPWRVQLGAFSVRGNADRMWSRVSGQAALSGKEKLIIPAGNVMKLQAGGFASRDAAQAACNALKRGGIECLATR